MWISGFMNEHDLYGASRGRDQELELKKLTRFLMYVNSTCTHILLKHFILRLQVQWIHPVLFCSKCNSLASSCLLNDWIVMPIKIYLTWRNSAAFTRIFSLRRDSISMKLKFASGDFGKPRKHGTSLKRSLSFNNAKVEKQAFMLHGIKIFEWSIYLEVRSYTQRKNTTAWRITNLISSR